MEKQLKCQKIKGILTIIGGFLLNLTNGSIFLWGTINIYITSYFRQKGDPDLSLSIGGAIFPLVTASFATGVPLGIKGIKFFGQARYILLISCTISSLLVIFSSFTDQFYQFAIIYGILGGIASGCICFIPIYMGYLHFPQNKGLVSGINTCGFSFCAFLFGLLFKKLVNPDGLLQNSNSDGYSYFDGDSISVAQNVPEALRTLGYIFLGVSLCASLIIFYHPNQIGEEEKRLKKQLELAQKEQKVFHENLISIEQEIKQIEQSLNIQNNQEQFQDQNNEKQQIQHILQKHEQVLLKQNQHIIEQKIRISEIQEQVLQQKIEISHKKDEKEGYSFSNQFIINEEIKQDQQNQGIAGNNMGLVNHTNKEGNHFHLKQNGSKPNDDKENQNVEKDFQKILEMMQNQIQNGNKEMHNNSNVKESEVKIEPTEDDLEKKEEQMKEELKLAKKRQEEIDELDKRGAPNILAALKQPKFYLSIFLAILCLSFGSLVNANYKSIAKDYGYKSDEFQTLVGSLAGIANGLSRPVWAGLLDKFKYKNLLILVLCFQIATCLSLQATDHSQEFFAVWIFVIHFCYGGILGMLPAFSAQLNGVKIGSQLFGFYFYGFSIANLIQFILVLELKNSIGFNNIFYICLGQLVLALIIINYFQFKIQWSKYYLLKKQDTLNTQSKESLQTNTAITGEQNLVIQIQQ